MFRTGPSASSPRVVTAQGKVGRVLGRAVSAGTVGRTAAPAEVARMLRCSEWWLKEQARHRRIPYAWIGGSYLFTAEHLADIIRRFEVRPADGADPGDGPAPPVRRPSAPAE